MCPPLIAALPGIMASTGAFITSAGGAAAIAAAGAAVSVYAQSQSAKAQKQALAVQVENERSETLERNEEEIGQRVRAAREARARAIVAAGESGALGASFAASINQSIQDQDADIALVAKNVAFSQRATDDRANTALASIRDPSALEAGLQIGGSALSGYNTGLSLQVE